MLKVALSTVRPRVRGEAVYKASKYDVATGNKKYYARTPKHTIAD